MNQRKNSDDSENARESEAGKVLRKKNNKYFIQKNTMRIKI